MNAFSGGTEVTVIGSNLDSVAEPRITLTVVVTRFYDEFYNETNATSTTNEISEVYFQSLANDQKTLSLQTAMQ